MKFNFKKIASVLTGAVMLSSTVALAAAANFPAPFVQSGAGDYAVVYGSGATTTDGVVAADINKWLAAKVTTTTPVTPTNASLTDGDSVMLAKSTNKFNLGESLNDFEATLDSDNLPVLLADGVYYNDANNDFEYEQTIKLSDEVLGWQQDAEFNDEKPFIGFDFQDGDHILNYTLDFTDDAEGVTGEFDKLENTVIKMMGRDYYISQAENTSNGPQLTLLDSANSVRINEGETQSLTVGDVKYDITLVSVNDNGASDSVNLEVNGVEISSELEEGDTAKIRDSDAYVGVKSVNYKSKEGSTSTAVITVGEGQLVLENGLEVELNGDPLSDFDKWEDHELKAFIKAVGQDIQEITLQWNANGDLWLAAGESLTLPGLETMKLSMGNFVTDKEEVTTLEGNTDRIDLKTEVADGSVTLPILYFNDTNIKGIGKSALHQLATSATTNIVINTTEDDWIVLSRYSGDEYESYVVEVAAPTSNSGKNTTKFTSAADSGNSVSIDSGEADEFTGGEITLTVNSANVATGMVDLTVSGTGVALNKIITKEGLGMKLPVEGNSADGYINLTTGGTATQWVMNFTEENEDENIYLGNSFTVTLGRNTDGDAEVDATSVVDYETEDGSDDYQGYVISPLATETLFKTGGDQDSIDITYHGTEAYAQVYVTESKVAFGEGGNGGSSGTVLVTDSQVASVQGKNLVVVGGSCVNTVAAKLLGSETPLCEAAWMSATNNVGAGSYLIKTFTNPWTSGQVATLVAGYDAADTENAVNALKLQDVDTTVGKEYVGRAGATLTLVQ